MLDLTQDSEPKALFVSGYPERHAATSPDMRWIAFTSNRTGNEEIWIATYPELQDMRPVSLEGGREPRWSHDGGELFYRSGYKMMVVPVTADDAEFTFEAPRVLFEGEYWPMGGSWPSYGVAPDGRFLMIEAVDQPTNKDSSQRIRIVLNWIEELKRLVPTE